MTFYFDEEQQDKALNTLSEMLDSGVPPEWIIERVTEAKTESLCYRVLLEVGLLVPEEQPVEA